MAEKKSILQINLLGKVSLTYQENTVDDQSIRSKKFWTVLEYLIAFRNKNISQAELVALIYPEGKSSNPSNALKTLMHRIRGGLDDLDYMDSSEMIIQTRGASYAWNAKMDCVIDVEEFEQLCDKGKVAADDEKLDCYLQAIELYKGDFLHKWAFEPWAAQLNTYYRALYSDTVHQTIDLLKQKNEHQKIIDLCKKALKIDAYDETLYYHLILGLINIDDQKGALAEYRRMVTLFYREFGISPSKELLQLYRQTIKTSKDVETDISIIKGDLIEEFHDTGPFFSEYEMFKDIYRAKVRVAARTGDSVCLGLFTLTPQNEDDSSVKIMNSYMDKLRDCISKTLRSSDIFAQYSVSQFILLMPFTTFEN
ncbi:MAG: bacterial transcriptional activator domain-containing protein, partial [Oscillospiraceae bacterium]|nr:bacterial transcriptional activator domain-containing protein [Oscillospiraceae bacterium]